jgi:hypothetical protein
MEQGSLGMTRFANYYMLFMQMLHMHLTMLLIFSWKPAEWPGLQDTARL